MGAVGSLVNSALGSKKGTTLDDFLAKFTSAEGTYVNTIDPLHTFDVSIKFHPLHSAADNSNDTGKDYLKNLARSIGMNAANNATGGIVGSIINDAKSSVLEQRKSFKSINDHTFLEYLTEASLLINSDNGLGASGLIGQSPAAPLELQIGYYIQSMTIPQLKMEDSGQADTMFGKFPMNGRYVSPDNNTITMSIINTKVPLLERVFYPWMREVTLPYWSYATQPFTTATITVDMTKHSDIKYVFYGCRPSQINTEQPTQEVDTTITRDVTLLFDFMYVTSDLETHESMEDKLKSTGQSLLNSGMGMLGL